MKGGNLPWYEVLKNKTIEEKIIGKQVADLKTLKSLTNICNGLPCENEFIKYFTYVKNL